MKKIQEEMIEAFKKDFGYFAILGKAGRFYDGGVDPTTRLSDINQFLLEWSEKILAEQKAEWVKKIEGAKFPYEHYWYEAKQDQRLCETCFEVVERYTPCKASKHYPCWQALNDLIQLIQEEI